MILWPVAGAVKDNSDIRPLRHLRKQCGKIGSCCQQKTLRTISAKNMIIPGIFNATFVTKCLKVLQYDSPAIPPPAGRRGTRGEKAAW